MADSRWRASCGRRAGVAGAGAHVVVIGAGLSGLSAALWLCGAGCAVTVVERAGTPGGLVRTETIDGSVFDTGATVLTMTNLVVEALEAVGVDATQARQRLGLVPVEPTYAARFADGTALDVSRDPTRLVDAVARTVSPADAAGVRRLQRWLHDLYDTEFGPFIDRDLSHLPTLLRTETLRAAVQLVRMGAVRRLSTAVARHVADPRLQRVFTFQALYAGMPPAQASAIYGVIAHMDIGRGVDHPIGGIGRVGAVMADALVEAGGRLRLSTPAVEIVTSHRRVVGVRVGSGADAEVLPADAVVSTTPIAETAALLGRPVPRTPRWSRIRFAPSAVVVHGRVPVAVADGWPGAHHTIDFGDAWDETFADLTRAPGQPMRDPSLLITRPAVTDPATFRTVVDGVATESVSVLAPCPNLDVAPLAWEHLAEPYVRECLRVLAGRGYAGIDDAFEVLRIDHPGTWAASGLPAGTPFSAAHSLTQTGPLRTPMRWPGLANLVVAGSATLPGVGIPPVLVSGRLAARRVIGAAA
ncbi:phytoene desaturase family protein [Gordonia sinesedis]